MPNPLSKVSPGATFSIGLHARSSLAERPLLAVLAMEAISSASSLEALMLRLFVTIFGGKESVAASVYLALETAGPKSAAISAAAQATLSKEQQSVLAAIQRLESRNRKERDKLAHHVWAHSAELPNAILLIDSRALTGDAVLDRSLIFVYIERDFSSIIDANKRVSELAQAFRFTMLSHAEKSQRDALFAKLLKEPEIQETLKRPA